MGLKPEARSVILRLEVLFEGLLCLWFAIEYDSTLVLEETRDERFGDGLCRSVNDLELSRRYKRAVNVADSESHLGSTSIGLRDDDALRRVEAVFYVPKNRLPDV